MFDIRQTARSVWADEFQRYLLLFVLLLGIYSLAFVSPVTLPGGQGGDGNVTVHFFYLTTCPHCEEQMPVNRQLMAEFPKAQWKYYEVGDQGNMRIFQNMMAERGQRAEATPTTIIGQEVVVGFVSQSTPTRLRLLLRSALGESNVTEPPVLSASPSPPSASSPIPAIVTLPFIGPIGTAQLSLPVLTIVLGLIDGFNPCAMWVLIFLISVTMTLHDRRKLVLIVGTFLLASGILYFLFMTFWLQTMMFVGMMRPVMVAVGAFAIFWGMLQLREFIQLKGQIACHTGDLGEKKKMRTQVQDLLNAPLTWATFAGLVVLAFSVNSVEFVCSSAIPLAFTNVLALQSMPWWQYYAYILLYVLFFMLDDMIVFSLAIFAVTGTVGDRIASYGHFIGALILLALGAMLLFAPQLLTV
jgi:thiol-disulfide isomerase/thioredoxin